MLSVGTGHCCIVPLMSVLWRLTLEGTAKAELIAAVPNWKYPVIFSSQIPLSVCN